MNAQGGLANRINCIIEAILQNKSEITWTLNEHCRLRPEDIFHNTIFQYLSFTDKPCQQNSVWRVSPSHGKTAVKCVAEIVFASFIPSEVIVPYKKCVHARWWGYNHQIDKNSFRLQAERFAGNDSTFILADSQRTLFNKIKNKTYANSQELKYDRNRQDISDQLNFCRDLKTLWTAEECLSNSWLTTITDMRAFLGKKTLIGLGDSFFQYTENFASVSGLKLPFLG